MALNLQSYLHILSPEITGVAHRTWFYTMLGLNLDFVCVLGKHYPSRAHGRRPHPPCNSLIVAVIYGVLPISK